MTRSRAKLVRERSALTNALSLTCVMPSLLAQPLRERALNLWLAACNPLAPPLRAAMQMLELLT